MDWTVIQGLIRPEMLAVAPFLYCVGAFLKLLPAFRAHWAIPLILLGLGAATGPAYMAWILGEGWSAATALAGVMQGVFLAALAVFAHQLIKQTLAGCGR